MIGCKRKLPRFFNSQSSRGLILALDHGVNSGLLQGLENVPALLENVREKRIQGLVLNKGLARAYGEKVPHELGLALQLSAGTRHGLPTYNRSIVCSVPEALRLGADAVSVHVNIGNDLEDRMLADFGMITDEAHQAGLPVLAVIYAQGGHIVNELDPSLIAHCVRLGGELGADLVSVLYPGESESFARAVAACPAPVFVAGGPSQPHRQAFLQMIAAALECGAAGVLAGRNVFQDPEPEKTLQALAEVVHGG